MAECYGHESTELRLDVRELGRGDRLGRAARGFFPLLAGALASLPIPGWHLAGVPGFLIAAFWIGWKRLRQAELFGDLEGRCPACGTAQKFPLPAQARFPATCRCPKCGEYVRVGGGERVPTAW